MKRFEIKVYREVTTYDKEWYSVDAETFEEAKKKILDYDESVEYIDGKSTDVINGEFVDEDQWVKVSEKEINETEN